MAPVVEDKKARIDNPFALYGGGRNVVNGLVYAGISVKIGAKLNANALAPLHDTRILVVARKVFRSVKRHVFEEMSEPSLVRFL